MESIENLDPRGKWRNLQKYHSHEVSRQLHLSDEELKILCLQRCSVLMYKFNVLTRISNAYDESCKAADKTPSTSERIRLFREKGLKVYKKFYEPRLPWISAQREYLRFLRQNEDYYKHNLENLSPHTSISKATVSGLSNETLAINSEEFMENLKSLPDEFHSTQGKDQDVEIL